MSTRRVGTKWFLSVGLAATAACTMAMNGPAEPPAVASASAPSVGQDADTQNIYYCELTGRFHRDISISPIRQLLDDAKRNKADVIICKIDAEFSAQRGDVQKEWVIDPQEALSSMEYLRQMRTMITDHIKDPSWGKQPRLVFWVKKAMGGVSMVPFLSPEMYFTTDGHLGGVGYAELIIGQGADEVVRRKWMDMSVTPMEGLALANGYDYRIVRAMFYMEYWLSYELKGGNPVYYERPNDPANPNEILLTDDGDEQAGRRDTEEDGVRLKGNDCLTLDSELAVRLNVAKGIADNLSDLIDLMGLTRDGKLLEKTKAQKITKDWAEGVDDAERDFRKLFQEFQDTPVRGDYKERTAARGKRIRILREMQSILEKYGEVIDPRAIYGDATGWDMNINIMIDRLKTEQRLDRPEETGRGR